MATCRTYFIETWLYEMPLGSGSFETFDQIKYNINDLKKNNIPVVSLSKTLKKIDLTESAYYWYEQNNVILIGVELIKNKLGWTVRMTGKNPDLRGKAPYASDLYNDILRDSKHYSIRILSDVQLSDEGLNIWKKLFDQGHKISVYDINEPGKTFQTFVNIKDFDDYFKNNDANFKRYQYILSESGSMVAETRSFFSSRRFREANGLDLTDYIPEKYRKINDNSTKF